ncbi:hypothetical protein [Shewanella psychromarinicola]|uniref:Uncharacterized protein n=1 Tax=Shewanella psychromarinicola TaxID=2487742 RepID=A0A3N4EL47_9GAMM|nr:hypothetical protein [Shewanella psychromarinicola]AZG36456.1 hypothetical protein EGC80_17400 [Shewanella psychromarinicola]MCL1084000.1 hypothetical protein [Shewanella psychromarinicola]RPA34301.1 hypothetical protein EGC77_01020 [Shewanella psychromarinicola]
MASSSLCRSYGLATRIKPNGYRLELQKLLSLYYSKEEVIDLSSLLISWSGSSQEAFNWLNKPIPAFGAFGNMTAIEACEKRFISAYSDLN